MLGAKIFFIKFFNSEHWPTFLFYVPIIPYFIYKSILARSLTYFLAVNPAIKYSGIGSESKFKTLGLLPSKYIPKSILIAAKSDFNTVIDSLNDAEIYFPLIAKPDVGFRGFLVRKIDSAADLKKYLNANKLAIILQELVDYPEECGLFYHKIPGTNKGKITSVTLKNFISVTGNGVDSLAQLILDDKRAFLYYKLFKKLHQENFYNIPPKGKIVKLTVIGNHSKGTQFINGNHLIDVILTEFLDELTTSIPDFYYGRFDVKFKTLAKLKNGQDFKILELNGILAEPTHIYDTDKSNYFASLKCIWQHWRIMDKIARKNHADFDVPYPKLKPFLKDLTWLRKHSKTIIRLNNE